MRNLGLFKQQLMLSLFALLLFSTSVTGRAYLRTLDNDEGCALAGTWEATFSRTATVLRFFLGQYGEFNYADVTYKTAYSLKIFNDGVAILGTSVSNATLPDRGDPTDPTRPFSIGWGGGCSASWKLVSTMPLQTMEPGSTMNATLILIDCEEPTCDWQGARLNVPSDCGIFDAPVTMNMGYQCRYFTLESPSFPVDRPLQFRLNHDDLPEETPLDFFDDLNNGGGLNNGEVAPDLRPLPSPCTCQLPGQWKIETEITSSLLSASATTIWDLSDDGIHGSGVVDVTVVTSVSGFSSSNSCTATFQTRSHSPMDVKQEDCSVSVSLDTYACSINCPGAEEIAGFLSCEQYGVPGNFHLSSDCKCMEFDPPPSAPGLTVTTTACRSDAP